MRERWVKGSVWFLSLFLFSCQSHPPKEESSQVLSEVSEGAYVSEGGAYPEQVEKAPSVAWGRLKALLSEMGIEPVGLELEPEEVLERIYTLFERLKKEGRWPIRMVYTGLRMEYDPQYQALTIGPVSVEEAYRYIKRRLKRGPPR